MTRIIFQAAFFASLALAGFSAFAQAEAEDGLALEEGVLKPKDKRNERPFHQLPLCRRLEGVGEVMIPGEENWEALEEGRFYPLGSTYRTVGGDSRLTIEFGVDCIISISGAAAFGTRAQEIGVKERTVLLKSGTIDISLPVNFPSNALKVASSGFVTEYLVGASRFTYSDLGDGDEAVVRCVSGALALKGRHFEIPVMYAANEVRIRTSQDMLFTGLYGTSGDYTVRLEQGLVKTKDDLTADEMMSGGKDASKDRVEMKYLDWKLSPKTAVRIVRAVPDVGEKLAVTVMTFNASGTLKNRCAFTEERYDLTTGEQGLLTRKEKEAIEKKAAELEAAANKSEAAEADE